MKIAAAQTLVTRDPKLNGAAIREQMREAARQGARLVHFAEGAISGYAVKEAETDWEAAASELAKVQSLARELSLWTVAGSARRIEGKRQRNSLHVVSDTGEIAARYDKRLCSLNEITNYYSAGFEPVVFEADGFRFGMLLCIEVAFAELFMEYERLGVDCLLFSADMRDEMSSLMLQGHAAGNCYWISASTPVKTDKADPAKPGAFPSGVIGPDGYWMARCAPQSAPGVAVVDLDRGDPRFDIALNKARPWMRVSRLGEIYRR